MSKLKKSTLLGIILVSAAILSACIPGQKNQTQTKEQAKNEMREMAKIMESGGSGYCELTDDQGAKLEYWFKGKKIKTKGMGFAAGMAQSEEDLNKVGYMISDAEYTYVWGENESEGVKMKLPSEEEIKEMAQKAEELADSMPDFTSEEVINEYEDQGYKINCQKKNISDSEFVAPKNIKFQDMSQMMEAGLKMGEEMMEKFDEGDLQEMQKMAEELEKKYGNY